MIDAEKIKSVLEKCEINRREWCEGCPYFGKWDCVSQLHKDVLDLLKEHDGLKHYDDGSAEP